MTDIISIKGWQSWSPCKKTLFKIPNYFYSPHKTHEWELNPTLRPKKPIKGWCSWYAFGSDINEDKILTNAKELTKYFPEDNKKYVIIDDGWAKIGDWDTSDADKFPNGMKSVADKIKSLGLKPGLWIAPFWADPRSNLAKNHPEYFVRDGNSFAEGFPLTSFKIPYFNFRLILDLENPNANRMIKNHIKNIIENWGYELLKLDFLYTPYFNPKYKDTKIPDKILVDFLSFIKKNYPDVYTIGCGCPLGPAAGLTDAMRVSSDIINPKLDNFWPINAIFNKSRIRQLENNLEERKGFSKIWNVDPDVFVSRKSTGLSKKDIKGLYKLDITANGLFILGDDLTKTTVIFPTC